MSLVIVGLVCCDWMAVFGAACFFFFIHSSFLSFSPCGELSRVHAGTGCPFQGSLVIQLHSWLLVYSLAHANTHSYIHFPLFHLLTNMHLFSKSLTHSLRLPFVIHLTISQIPTDSAERTISASHVNNPFLVHLICADQSIPLSSPLFSCRLPPDFPLSTC